LACTVEFLPAGLPVAAPIERDAAARSLPRAVRLYFYKVFARALPSDAGLRRADLADGRAVFHPVEAADLAGAQRAALLIHGFLGDTRWMVERVWSWTRANGAYDLCLTFDYESFGVGIRRNAELLAAALKAVGIGPEDGLHLDIFAHGMGSQVARALIELLGGHSYVNRLFMGGPPNAGTPLASGRALLPWLGNLLVNLAGSASPALVAHWLLDRFTGTAHGLADLEPDSRFLQDLNAPWRAPADIPYFIQIGDNSRAYPQAGALARRLMGVLDSGLDTLFAGDNDLIVGVNSARSLESRWPRLEVALLGVNHFGYFYTEEGRRALARWLSQA
jgi:hypothetical protein